MNFSTSTWLTLLAECQSLKKSYNQYDNTSTCLINLKDTTIRHYLFTQNYTCAKSLANLINITCEPKPFNPVKLSSLTKSIIKLECTSQHKLNQFKINYICAHQKYITFAKKHKSEISALLENSRISNYITRKLGLSLNFVKNHGTKISFSTGEMKILKHLCKKKLIHYQNYRFSFCKNKISLSFDFLCVIIKEDSLVMFVVEFDGDQHFKQNSLYDFKSNHQRDILKQHYLRQLNIHLLRLNEESDFEEELDNFIKKVSKTGVYLCQNPIEPIEELFNDDSEHSGLCYFNHFYDKHGNDADYLKQ